MVRVLVGMCMALLMMVQSCLAADVAALVKVKDGKIGALSISRAG